MKNFNVTLGSGRGPWRGGGGGDQTIAKKCVNYYLNVPKLYLSYCQKS